MRTERIVLPEAIDIVCPLIVGKNLVNPIRVTIKSPKSYRQAVYRIADFFRREFQYDFVQYGVDGEENDPNHVAFLWVHREGEKVSEEFKVPCIGACCFRLRESDYALQWAWIHPYRRRQGLLESALPELKEEFGEFYVEPPLSKAMKAFLKKHNI
jgi:hypothetical protein